MSILMKLRGLTEKAVYNQNIALQHEVQDHWEAIQAQAQAAAKLGSWLLTYRITAPEDDRMVQLLCKRIREDGLHVFGSWKAEGGHTLRITWEEMHNDR